MSELLVLFCLILMVILAVTAVICRSLIRSAVALAGISAVLSLLMFIMGAPTAALFELSVCAGLVTVIFISTISMTQTARHTTESKQEYRSRFAMLPFLLIILGVTLIAVMLISDFTLVPGTNISNVANLSFKEILWNTRQADILGQICIIIAGAFAVVILFKEANKE